MSERKLAHHLVTIAPAVLLPKYVTVSDQLREDSVGRAFGDPDLFGDLPKPDPWVPRDAREDMGMVGQEVPGWSGGPPGGQIYGLRRHVSEV